MKIEIVEYYEHVYYQSKGHFIGTMHIRIPELEMEVRGIVFTSIRGKRKQQKKGIYMEFPFKIVYSVKDKKFNKYPYLSFTNPTKNMMIQHATYQKGVAYLLEKFYTKEEVIPPVEATA